MNEYIFIFQLFLILFSLLGSVYLGKEALFIWLVLQELLANIFVIKQIELFGFTVTGSDAFAVGSIFTLNLLQEFYGKKEAQRAIRISFCAMLFYTLLAQVHLQWQASPFDQSHLAYTIILGPSPRILLASITVFFLIQQVDMFFFHWLKRLFKGKSLSLRTACSLVLSQFFDTVLFSFFALFGIVESISDLITLSFLIKCIAIALFTPFAGICQIIQNNNTKKVPHNDPI